MCSNFPVGADESQVTAGIVITSQDLLSNVTNGLRHKVLGDATPEKRRLGQLNHTTLGSRYRVALVIGPHSLSHRSRYQAVLVIRSFSLTGRAHYRAGLEALGLIIS